MPLERIERKILLLRGEKVLLDRDLADLYLVRPIALRQQVKRNRNRFPPDFMFQLTAREAGALVSQSVIPSRKSLGGALPYAFTEQGVAMLSSVLRSDRAVSMNIAIMRTFVRLRHRMADRNRLLARLDEHDQLLKKHGADLVLLFDILEQLGSEPEGSDPARIGFNVEPEP